MNPKFFDDLSQRIAETLKGTPIEDMQKNAKALLSSGFAKLDLVTREEFDVQSQVLARTREKLALLEGRIAELEASHATSGAGKPVSKT